MDKIDDHALLTFIYELVKFTRRKLSDRLCRSHLPNHDSIETCGRRPEKKVRP
jgi:hypothetical protein